MRPLLTIKIFKAMALIVLSMVLVGCQDTIPNRSLITDGSIGGGTTGGDGGGDDVVVTRPNNAIKFKTDFCGCKDTTAVTYGNACAAYCADKNTQALPVLFANFTVTEDISLNTAFGSVNGWCNNIIEDEGTNPVCVVKAVDENNVSTELAVTPGLTSNSLKVALNTLAQDKAYVLTLVEKISGSKSDSVQIIMYSADIPLSTLGPLKNAPITQYSCISRPASVDNNTGEIYYDAAFRVHFYFLPRIPPDPITAGSDIVCHDWLNPLYGAIDDALYPRLEQVPGAFNLWDNTDPRFYDLNGNANNEVNDIIIQKARNFGAINLPSSSNFFQPFPVMSSVSSNTAAGNNTSAQSMGYYMPPWINQTTFRSYCLNASYYNSTNPLFKAMRDVIGVDTEGIYIGMKAAETVIDRDGNVVTAPNDFIMIRETQLKQVWFYLNNNVPTYPSDAVVSSVPVYFYYPINTASPYVRSSTQKLYQVKGANELSNSSVTTGGSNSAGVSTNYPPHDRKFGCVPKF